MNKRLFFTEEYKKVEEAERKMNKFKLGQIQILLDSSVIPNELKTCWKLSIENDGLNGLSGVLSCAGWIVNSFATGVSMEMLGIEDEDFISLIRVMFKNIKKKEEQFQTLFKWWYEETLLERMAL